MALLRSKIYSPLCIEPSAAIGPFFYVSFSLPPFLLWVWRVCTLWLPLAPRASPSKVHNPTSYLVYLVPLPRNK